MELKYDHPLQRPTQWYLKPTIQQCEFPDSFILVLNRLNFMKDTFLNHTFPGSYRRLQVYYIFGHQIG